MAEQPLIRRRTLPNSLRHIAGKLTELAEAGGSPDLIAHAMTLRMLAHEAERDLLLTDIDPSPWIAQRQREMEAEALREMNSSAHERATETLTGHCGPGRCLGLTCCSYECAQGRCTSAIAAGIIPAPDDPKSGT